MKKLYIISNEKIFCKDNNFYCDNIDLKSTPEELSENFEVFLIGKKSKNEKLHKINIKNIYIFRSIFFYINCIFRSFKDKDTRYLIISITPYTLLASLFLKIFNRSSKIYLRSDGFGEYRAILGIIGPFIYQIMFTLSSITSELISCRSFILRGKKGDIISPSQLDERWFQNQKKPILGKRNLLYVGRIKVEKGIYSLVKIIENKKDISLSIVGAEKNGPKKINQNNVKVFDNENNKEELIKYYDDHNIFILPSFTEGHPMVLLEALARLRPVIIFKDIAHVIGEKKGIFAIERNYEDLLKIINYIFANYEKIQLEMNNNKLPTKKNFINDLKNIINPKSD